jgi:uncharacterized membrane protein
MARFLGVLAVFLIAHVIPALPAVRRPLRDRLGAGGFLGAYSLLSLLLFIWLIREALLAPYIPLWFAGTWGHWFAAVLMPLALMLLGASVLAPNPLSIAFVDRPWDPARPGVVAVTRHPILWGLGLWGVAHVPANGHAVGLLLFGILGVFAFVGMAITEQRRQTVLGKQTWHELAGRTSVLPFAAILEGRARWPTDPLTLTGAAAGLLAAAVLLFGGHLWLFGRDPLALL